MDPYDALAVAGVVMLFAGLLLIDVRLALVVVGTLFLAGGVFGAMWRARS